MSEKKTKKVSYANLLKEALSDYTDTPKNVDTLGPFLDPILSYKGDGELPTHKDAASILERYYFKQEQDEGVTISLDEEESVVNKDIVTVGKDKAALADEPESVKKSKDDTEDAMAMEQEEMDVEEEEEETEEVEEQMVPEEPAGLSGDEKELPPRKGKDGEGQVEPAKLESQVVEEDDSVENAVIEKLISEMEEEEADEEAEEEEAAPVAEQDEEAEEEKEEEEEELDVDKEMEEEEEEEEEAIEEQIPIQKIAGAGGLDKEEMEEMYESFQIFKEQIEEDDTPDISSDEVIV